MKNNVIFYGPFETVNVENKNAGGGEVGNKKTLRLLLNIGMIVDLVKKPYPKNIKILKPILYLLELTYSFFVFFLKLFKYYGNGCVHISGFYSHLIYLEILLVFFAKIFKYKVIYEMRAGGMLEMYNEKGRIYRSVFKWVICIADVILCQGKDYMPFIKNLGGRTVIYYPNFVMDSYLISDQNDCRDIEDKISIIYFGRLVKQKRIDIIIKVVKVLKENKYDVSLEIIGNGPKDYIDKIKKEIDHYGINECVRIIPYLSDENEVRKIAIQNKYFIFPTEEKREGHSNALTEAMALGIVPVCSNNGFNKSVVNDDYLIVDNSSPEEYVKKILNINKKWIYYSKKVSHRVMCVYSESVIKKVIEKVYK